MMPNCGVTNLDQLLIDLIRSGQIAQEDVPGFLDRQELTEAYRAKLEGE